MSSVLKDRETPKNPLGIISLFVFFIEAIATVSLGLAAKTPYVGHLVWFIILYPTFIACTFFVLLYFKREALYSPADYRDDATFRDLLLRKVEVISAKQDAAQISVVTDINEVMATIDRLVSLDDVYTAVNVGRAYFKEKDYAKAVQVFERMLTLVPESHPLHYRVLANLGYAMNGANRFEDAIRHLGRVKTLNKGRNFRVWHAVALAHACKKTGDAAATKRWLAEAKKLPTYEENQAWFCELYPELHNELR